MNWKALLKAVLTVLIPANLIYSFNLAPEFIREFLKTGFLYSLLGIIVSALIFVLYCMYDETLDDDEDL